MIIRPPKIDVRSPEDLLGEIESLVPFYAAEWEPSEGDTGSALMKILANMLEAIIHRINRAPEKNFIKFLDKIGVKLLCAQPARVPLTFMLSEGAAGSVRIPERTQAAAGEIVFQTEKEILATPCKLVRAYSVEEDAIYESPSNVREGKIASPFSAYLAYGITKQHGNVLFLNNASGLAKGDSLKINNTEGSEYAVVSEVSGKRVDLKDKLNDKHGAGAPVEKVTTFELFEGKDLQEHALYLGHTDFFNIKGGAKITVHFGNAENLSDLEDGHLVRWEYWGEQANAEGNDGKAQDWYPFDNVHIEGDSIVLEKNSTHKVTVTEQKINGIKSRWIRCVVWPPMGSATWEDTHLRLPAKAVRGVGDMFGPRLCAGGVHTVGQLLEFENRVADLAKMLRKGGPERPELYELAENILENAKKRILDHQYESVISAETKDHGMQSGTESIVKAKNITLNSIQATSWPIVPEYCDLPPEALRDVGEERGKMLSVAGIRTIEQLLAFENTVVDLAKILSKKGQEPSELYEWAENVLENARNRIMDEKYEDIAEREIAAHGLLPDMAFYNDVPLNIKQTPIYPFGKIPRLYDTFYIASQEAFSKKQAGISMHITLKESSAPSDNLCLSWEYWNGSGWVVIDDIDKSSYRFDNKVGVVCFDCPEDIKSTKVNGHESYWIRVRIISGDYGKGKVQIDPRTQETWVSLGPVKPPEITNLSITYSFPTNAPLSLQHCLTYNNLEFKDATEESKNQNKTFKPFEALEDEYQALYLGFDKKLEKGPISIFFLLEEQEYLEENIPRVVWECYAEKEGKGAWTRLEVLDETRNLTRSGTINFVFPPNFVKNRRFGNEAYWIRATVDIDKKFLTQTKASATSVDALIGRNLNPVIVKKYILPALKKYRPDTYKIWNQKLSYLHSGYVLLPPSAYAPIKFSRASEKVAINAGNSLENIEPCCNQLLVFDPEWSVPPEMRQYPLAPKIKGIYLNTTWSIQAETIEDEILGSSNGTEDQTFNLTKIPVISEEIWVNELSALSEGERKNLLEESEPNVNEFKDEKGNTTEFWIRWQHVDDLLGSSKNSRDYEVDRMFGRIKFGDGTNGRIPPIGTDNIKANYTSGGGKKANVAASEIGTLLTSIPFVDKVSNPIAADGSSDTETLENALERGPQIVRHRNRAVTEEDFEWLTKQASRDIARAKCLANFDDKGEFQAGWVTVLVVPQSKEDRPKLSLQLKNQLERYLKEHCPSTVVFPEQHLRVSEPAYLEVSVETEVASATVDAIAGIEKEVFSKLKEFLHPLSGGYEGRGWDFGRMPCLSDLFDLLEKIPEVNHVETLLVRIRADGKELVITPDSPSEAEIPPYTLICSGEHKIQVTYKGEV